MSKDKKNVYTPSDIRRMQEEMSAKTVCLVLATLMDEFDFGKPELEGFVERFCRYNDAVNTHLITIQTVAKIVEKQTGVKMKW